MLMAATDCTSSIGKTMMMRRMLRSYPICSNEEIYQDSGGFDLGPWLYADHRFGNMRLAVFLSRVAIIAPQ
jgi:hypothetical protein